MAHLDIGTVVELKGLKGGARYNGLKARICKTFDHRKGRYDVRLEGDGTQFAVRPENISILSASEPIMSNNNNVKLLKYWSAEEFRNWCENHKYTNELMLFTGMDGNEVASLEEQDIYEALRGFDANNDIATAIYSDINDVKMGCHSFSTPMAQTGEEEFSFNFTDHAIHPWGLQTDFRPRESMLCVVKVYDGQQASRLGVKPGDVVSAVDGIEINQNTCDAIRVKLRNGNSCTLKCRRTLTMKSA